MSFGDGAITHVLVNPTGSDINTANERASLLGIYGGIAIDAPAGGTTARLLLINPPGLDGGMVL